jgi:hypothetical protein
MKRYRDMNYVSQVANSILSHTNCVSVLGPEIYTAIAEWEKKEIPLSLVIESIDEVCGDTREAAGTVESIDKLQAAVNENFRIWLANRDAKNLVGI